MRDGSKYSFYYPFNLTAPLYLSWRAAGRSHTASRCLLFWNLWIDWNTHLAGIWTLERYGGVGVSNDHYSHHGRQFTNGYDEWRSCPKRVLGGGVVAYDRGRLYVHRYRDSLCLGNSWDDDNLVWSSVGRNGRGHVGWGKHCLSSSIPNSVTDPILLVV